MKSKKKIVLNIIGILFLILGITLFVKLLHFNMLPTKFIVLIGVCLLVFNILSFILINSKKIGLNIVGIVIDVIIAVIIILGIYYISSTDGFLNKVLTKKNTYTTTYYVVGRNDLSKEDIKGDIYYYNNFNIDSVKKYLNNDYELNYHEVDSLYELFLNIKDGSKDLMLIDKSTYSIFFDVNNSLSSNDYKIIYKFDITKKIKNEKKNTKEIFNLLIVGTDFANLNDLNLLITFNLKTNRILVTTIPRAYYIEVDGKGGKKDTLSFMAPYGIDTTIKSIENYFKIDIDYYLKINTHSLVKLVDEIGGINYCSDQAFYTSHSLVLDTYVDNKGKFYVKKGCQELNGIQTLTVARERKAFAGGDRVRQQNCVKIMQAILDKMISTNTLTNYNNILNSMTDLYETDISKEQINLISKKIISKGVNIKLEMQSVDGYETMDYVHLTDLKDYVIVPIESTVTLAVKNINEFMK